MDRKCKNALGDTALEFALAITPRMIDKWNYDVLLDQQDPSTVEELAEDVWRIARVLARGEAKNEL